MLEQSWNFPFEKLFKVRPTFAGRTGMWIVLKIPRVIVERFSLRCNENPKLSTKKLLYPHH